MSTTEAASSQRAAVSARQLKPGHYVMRDRFGAQKVEVVRRRYGLEVIVPSGWGHLAETFGDEYLFEEVPHA